jgi:hypothetical protein
MSRTTNRRRLTPATIISVLALFVGLSGTAYAAATIGTDDIKNKAVTTPKLDTEAVTTAKLAPQAVKPAKIAPGAVRTAKIFDAAVTTAKIADAAVTTAEIADAAVTTAEIANGAVSNVKIADAAVTTAKLANGAVSNSKLGNNSVTTAKIQDGQVRALDLGAINERTNSTTLAAGASGSVVVSCNAGERPISGGHFTSGNDVWARQSHRHGLYSWYVSFRNNDAVTRNIGAVAYCLEAAP